MTAFIAAAVHALHTATVPVTCRYCKRPIIRCDTQPGHGGCSSGYGWIHDEPFWGHACTRRAGPYKREYARPEAESQP